MAICSRAATMSSLCGVVALQPKDLWSLVFRVLPKLLVLPPRLRKKFRIHAHVHPSLMELETWMGTSPELPQDMLMNIFAKLGIPDLMRAGSVCSSWRCAYTSLRNLGKHKKSQTPCLLYTSESAGENVACLYSLTEQRVYKLTLPEPPIRSRFLIGSSNGWLITADERSELQLVNPITGEQIPLPSVITIEQVKPIADRSGVIRKYELSYHTAKKVYEAPEIYALKDLREHLYFKAFMFSDPSSGSYIVVLIHNPYKQLSFARAGDDKWSWLPVIIDELKQYIYESMYIIQAPWGDLLQVWRTVDLPEQEDEGPPKVPLCTLKIKVYKVDMEAKQLVEIQGLPHHMLFLGYNNSVCLSAEEHPQLKANHVYFTDDYIEQIIGLKNDPRDGRDIGVLNLENGSRQEIVSQIWSNRPCPVWMTPNITNMNLAFSK